MLPSRQVPPLEAFYTQPPFAVPGLTNHLLRLGFRPGYRPPGTLAIVAPRPGYGLVAQFCPPRPQGTVAIVAPRPGQGGASRETCSGSSGEHGPAVYSGLPSQQPRPWQMGVVRPSRGPPPASMHASVLPLPAWPPAGFAKADEVADTVGLGDEGPKTYQSHQGVKKTMIFSKSNLVPMVSRGVRHCKMTGTASLSFCCAELLRRPILRAIGCQSTF